MDDLIKRDDVLAAIDTFKRDFEQSWKVQFSADIKALPAIDPAAIREAALREAAELVRSTSYTSSGDKRSLEPVSAGLKGMDMHHATIADAILALIGEKK